MKKKNPISISRNLTISLVLTVMLASAFMTGFNYFNAVRKTRTEMEKNTRERIVNLTDILKLPLWAIDYDAVRQIGRSFSQDDLIAQLKIIDTTGEILFNIDKKTGGYLIKRNRKIVHGGTHIGDIEIALTSRYYEESNIRLLISSIIMTIIIVAVLIVLTGFFLRTFLEKPLEHLGNTARSYSEGNYHAPESRTSVKEFVQFLSILKKMGETIHAQMTALKTSEMKYRTLIEQAADAAFVLDSKGKFNDVNQKACDSLGYTRQELLGMSMSQVNHDFPVHRLAVLLDHDGHGKTISIEGIHQRKDQSTLFVEVHLGTIEQEHQKSILALARDITDRKEVEQALRTSENRLQAIIDNTPSVIYLKDSKSRYILINKQFESLFNITREQTEGRTDFDIFPENLAMIFRKNDNDVLQAGVPMEFDETMPGNNGPHTYLSLKFPLIDNTGTIYAVCGVSTDITEREKARQTIRKYSQDLEKQVNERTRQLQEKTVSLEKSKQALSGLLEDVYTTKVELEKANDKLKELDHLKSMFMASMSHELRTPLNSIIGFTGILLNELAGPLNMEQKKQLRMVKGSGRHLLNLINDVLDISKIEAGKLEISRETFRMPDVIRQVTEELAPLAVQKALSLLVDISPEIDAVNSDKRRVHQVLINLVNNAIKFTDEGEVRISSRISGDDLETRIQDTGIGIRTDDMNKLFKPFQQIDTGLARKYEGTGLGLNVCKHIIEVLGGKIDVQSEYGKGSCFTFSLPLKKQEGKHGPKENRPGN